MIISFEPGREPLLVGVYFENDEYSRIGSELLTGKVISLNEHRWGVGMVSLGDSIGEYLFDINEGHSEDDMRIKVTLDTALYNEFLSSRGREGAVASSDKKLALLDAGIIYNPLDVFLYKLLDCAREEINDFLE